MIVGDLDNSVVVDSGWLSGKIKRQGQLEEGSRMAWSSSKDGRPNQAFPTFEEFDNENTWKLLDLMEKIAKNNGKNELTFK